MEQPIAKTVLKNESMIGGFTTPDFKTNYEARVIRTISHWHKNRKIEQCYIIQPKSTSTHVR